jgi:hypothetical protein
MFLLLSPGVERITSRPTLSSCAISDVRDASAQVAIARGSLCAGDRNVASPPRVVHATRYECDRRPPLFRDRARGQPLVRGRLARCAKCRRTIRPASHRRANGCNRQPGRWRGAGPTLTRADSQNGGWPPALRGWARADRACRGAGQRQRHAACVRSGHRAAGKDPAQVLGPSSGRAASVGPKLRTARWVVSRH